MLPEQQQEKYFSNRSKQEHSAHNKIWQELFCGLHIALYILYYTLQDEKCNLTVAEM